MKICICSVCFQSNNTNKHTQAFTHIHIINQAHYRFPFDLDVLCYLIVNLYVSTQQLIRPFMDNFHKPFRNHWQPSLHPNEKVRISDPRPALLYKVPSYLTEYTQNTWENVFAFVDYVSECFIV